MGTKFEVTDNGMKVGSLSSDPTTDEGSFYYNSTTKKIKFYNGTSWEEL